MGSQPSRIKVKSLKLTDWFKPLVSFIFESDEATGSEVLGPFFVFRWLSTFFKNNLRFCTSNWEQVPTDNKRHHE